ncbi:MAG: prepilin-type cleavage/methylation-like protein [Oceanisphaera sp.]|uniref:type IV pilus modification PilV family protein n=1 Tax=Oceanisphaera sp. TaxID=1929979 RepID=UPI003C78D1FE
MALNLRFIFSRMPSLIPNKPVVKLKQAGVSLLEFVLGLVLLSIVLLGVTLFYANNTRQLDPVFQFRAVSLAEAIAEQVLVVKYDANNNPYQQLRCDIEGENGESPEVVCSNEIVTTDNKITEFSVVDDFQLWCDDNLRGATGPINGEVLAEQLGLPHEKLYQRFSIVSCVEPIDDAPNPPYKLVTIKVKIDTGDSISFTLHRYNIL